MNLVKVLQGNPFKKHKKYQFNGLLYVVPWIIGIVLFQIYPFIASFIYSFTDYSILSKPEFTGLDNFIYMFTKDDSFYQSLKATLQFVFFAVPAKIVFALFIAMALNVRLKLLNIFRTVYYIPSILGGSVAISILWRFLFTNDGLVNKVLAFVSLPPVNWLGSPSIAIYTLCILPVWQFGSSMVIFLAGLKNIPKELYESGKVDGASKVKLFFAITLPFLTPLILFNVILQMVGAFQEFTAPMVITGGGPLKSTYLFGLKLYDEAFTFFKMGYSSALSWTLFGIIMIVTFIIFKTSHYWTYYDDGGKG